MFSGFYMSSRFLEMTKFWRAVMLGEELTSSDRFAGGQFEPDLVAALFSAHLCDSKHLQVRMKCSTLSSPSLQRHSGLLACWIRFRKALSLQCPESSWKSW